MLARTRGREEGNGVGEPSLEGDLRLVEKKSGRLLFAAEEGGKKGEKK